MRARIVSLVPSITELVCELGLADRLVGRTGFCIHPRAIVRRIPKVGGTKDVDLEKVRALAPTHAIVNVDENRKETADALAAFVPHVVVTHPLAPEDNFALFRLVGETFGVREEAEALCERLRQAWTLNVKGELPPRRVLYLVWKDPWMTVSRDTYISRMLALFGLQTVPVDSPERYPKLGLDDPLVGEAEMVLLSTEPYRFREAHAAEISARLGKRACLINGEMTSWYGSRAIAGLAYLADFARSL